MAPSSRSHRSRRASRSRVAGRVAAGVAGATLLLAIAATAWIGARAYLAYGHLDGARATASGLAADPAAAAAAIDAVAVDAAAAHELTSDPVWRFAEGVPWIGPQLAAVATIAAAADDVAGTALQPLADVAATFSIDSLRPVDGAIDTAQIAGLRDVAAAGAEGMRRGAASLDAIDSGLLLPSLREPLADVSALMQSVGDGADALARASELMPAMLGSEGARSYLVLFQNNAEWRSLGGIVGATAVVSADGGRLSLTAQASSGDFRQYDDSVLPLSEELLAVYESRPGRYIQNATQLPDFPTGAQLAREMWARESGVQVDGVLSLDPVALSYLLEATGPVTLPTGDVLTSENAVSLLLNEVYLRYERPIEQDAFFQAAAAATFAAVSSGRFEPAALIEALARAGAEHRLLLWNARPEEQSVLDGTTLQGALPVTDDEQTTFGVYLNDSTGAKMDYYLEAQADAQWCRVPGRPDEAQLVVRLLSHAPSDAATLPDYITGANVFGIPPGTARTYVRVYLPEGSSLLSSSTTAGGDLLAVGTDSGHQVLAWVIDLEPGQSAEAGVRVSTPTTPALSTRTTPTVYTPEMLPVGFACAFPG